MAHSDRDPEVIDVTRDFVGFRGESDRYFPPRAQTRPVSTEAADAYCALAVSMWQSEIEYGAPQSPVERRESCTRRGASFAVIPEARRRQTRACTEPMWTSQLQNAIHSISGRNQLRLRGPSARRRGDPGMTRSSFRPDATDGFSNCRKQRRIQRSLKAPLPSSK